MAADDNVGGNTLDPCKPASTVPATSAEEVKKKKKKRRPDAGQSVFESQPAVSSADAAHKDNVGTNRTAEAQALIGAALEEDEGPESVFESEPQKSSAAFGAGVRESGHEDGAANRTVFETTPTATCADAVAGTWSSRAPEAFAVIAAAEEDEQEERSVFQSSPVQTSADTGHATGGSANCDVPDADGVFESRPSHSGADVAHSKVAGNHARDAEALILASAELEGEDAAGVVFEKNPSQSAADIRHADSNSRYAAQAEATILAATAEDHAVFESQPRQTTADLRHSDSLQASDAAVVFESDPKPSQAHVGHGTAAQKVLANASTAGVFESAPVKSTANASAGATEVWESEYETDESEAEVEVPPN